MLLDCDNCHINIHLIKIIKIGEFCAAILILKMEQNMQHFQCITPYCFKNSKRATEMQKKICAVYGEGAVTD